MVLRNSGRVGSRRFLIELIEKQKGPVQTKEPDPL